jgi:hypothetical protein
MRMSGFGWAALNFLWLVPVVIGVAFVAAVLLVAAWRSYRSQRNWGARVEQSYAGSKPTLADNRADPADPAPPHRRVP